MVVASNFTFGGNDANWASDYIPLAPEHGDTWDDDGVDAEGRTWAENTYDGWSALSDADLLIQHQTNLANLAGGTNDLLYADYVEVSGQILTERNLN